MTGKLGDSGDSKDIGVFDDLGVSIKVTSGALGDLGVFGVFGDFGVAAFGDFADFGDLGVFAVFADFALRLFRFLFMDGLANASTAQNAEITKIKSFIFASEFSENLAYI